MATAMVFALGVPMAHILLQAGAVIALLGVLMMIVGGAVGSALARALRGDVLVLLAFLLGVSLASRVAAQYYARTADPAFTISRSTTAPDPRLDAAHYRAAVAAMPPRPVR